MRLLERIVQTSKRIVRRSAGLPVTEYDQKLKLSREAYEFYQNLVTKNDGMDKIIFSEEGAVIVLSDGRKFHYDPRTDVNRLYRVQFEGTHEPAETEGSWIALQPNS